MHSPALQHAHGIDKRILHSKHTCFIKVFLLAFGTIEIGAALNGVIIDACMSVFVSFASHEQSTHHEATTSAQSAWLRVVMVSSWSFPLPPYLIATCPLILSLHFPFIQAPLD